MDAIRQRYLVGVGEHSTQQAVPFQKKDQEVRYIAIRKEVKDLSEAKKSDAHQMELEIEGLEADNPNLKKLYLMVLGDKVWKTFLKEFKKFRIKLEEVAA